MTASTPEVDWAALLDGRVAVITGAGSGQGRAAALLFAAHGASVAVVDIDVDAAEETLGMLDSLRQPGFACTRPCAPTCRGRPTSSTWWRT